MHQSSWLACWYWNRIGKLPGSCSCLRAGNPTFRNRPSAANEAELLCPVVGRNPTLGFQRPPFQCRISSALSSAMEQFSLPAFARSAQPRDRRVAVASLARNRGVIDTSLTLHWRVGVTIGAKRAEFALRRCELRGGAFLDRPRRLLTPARRAERSFSRPKQILRLRMRSRRLSLSPCPNRS